MIYNIRAIAKQKDKNQIVIIEYKTLELFGKETIIRAKANATHRIVDKLENEACFYFVLDGASTLNTSQGNLKVERNEGVVLQCGNYLGNFFTSLKKQIVDIIIVKIDKEIVRKIYRNDLGPLFDKVNNSKSLVAKKISTSPQLEQYVESLMFYLENNQFAIEELIILKIKELILLLANSDQKVVIRQLLESLYNPQQVAFQQVIEQNLIGPLTVKEIAHICSMSASTFQRKFKAIYVDSPRKYLIKKRMEWAANRIKNSEVSITQISDNLGYSDLSNFSLAFKKFHGVSPSELS